MPSNYPDTEDYSFDPESGSGFDPSLYEVDPETGRLRRRRSGGGSFANAASSAYDKKMRAISEGRMQAAQRYAEIEANAPQAAKMKADLDARGIAGYTTDAGEYVAVGTRKNEAGVTDFKDVGAIQYAIENTPTLAEARAEAVAARRAATADRIAMRKQQAAQLKLQKAIANAPKRALSEARQYHAGIKQSQVNAKKEYDDWNNSEIGGLAYADATAKLAEAEKQAQETGGFMAIFNSDEIGRPTRAAVEAQGSLEGLRAKAAILARQKAAYEDRLAEMTDLETQSRAEFNRLNDAKLGVTFDTVTSALIRENAARAKAGLPGINPAQFQPTPPDESAYNEADPVHQLVKQTNEKRINQGRTDFIDPADMAPYAGNANIEEETVQQASQLNNTSMALELGRLKAIGQTHIGAQPIDTFIQKYGGDAAIDNDRLVEAYKRTAGRMADISATLENPDTDQRVAASLKDEAAVLSRVLAEKELLVKNRGQWDRVRDLNATDYIKGAYAAAWRGALGTVSGGAEAVLRNVGRLAGQDIGSDYQKNVAEGFDAANKVIQTEDAGALIGRVVRGGLLHDPTAFTDPATTQDENVTQKFGDTLTSTIATGAGSTIPFMAAGAGAGSLARAFGLGAKATAALANTTTAISGAAVSANDFRDQAEQGLKDKLTSGEISQDEYDSALNAAEGWGAIAGTSEAAPLGKFFGQVAKFNTGKIVTKGIASAFRKGGAAGAADWIQGAGKGWVRRLGTEIATQTAEEGTQEFSQSVMNNLVSHGMLGNQGWEERQDGFTGGVSDALGGDSLEGAASGGVTGALMAGIFGVGRIRGLKATMESRRSGKRGTVLGNPDPLARAVEAIQPTQVDQSGNEVNQPTVDPELQAQLDAELVANSAKNEQVAANVPENQGNLNTSPTIDPALQAELDAQQWAPPAPPAPVNEQQTAGGVEMMRTADAVDQGLISEGYADQMDPEWRKQAHTLSTTEAEQDKQPNITTTPAEAQAVETTPAPVVVQEQTAPEAPAASDPTDAQYEQLAAEDANPEHPLNGKRIGVGIPADGTPDILNIIEELGGIKHPDDARNVGGEYDAFKESMQGTARALVRRGGRGQTPDQIHQQLQDMGYGKAYPTVDSIFAAIAGATENRKKVAAAVQERDRVAKFEDAFVGDKPNREFLRGQKPITLDVLNVGDKFKVNGDEFAVKAIDPEGNVTVAGQTAGKPLERTYHGSTTVYPDRGQLTAIPTPELQRPLENHPADVKGQAVVKLDDGTEIPINDETGGFAHDPQTGEVIADATTPAALVQRVGRAAKLDYAKDPAPARIIGNLASRLHKASPEAFGKMRVAVLSNDEWAAHPGLGSRTPDSAGAYDPDTNVLYLNSSKLNGSNAVNVFVHEAGHFAERFAIGEEFAQQQWESLTEDQRAQAHKQYSGRAPTAPLVRDTRARSEWFAMQFARVVLGDTEGMDSRLKVKLTQWLAVVRDYLSKWIGDKKLTTKELDAKILEVLGVARAKPVQAPAIVSKDGQTGLGGMEDTFNLAGETQRDGGQALAAEQAKRDEAAKQTTLPGTQEVSTAPTKLDEANREAAKPAVEQEPMTVQGSLDFYKRVRNGNATANEVRDRWTAFKAAKGAINAELLKSSKQELTRLNPFARASDTKESMVRGAMNTLESLFAADGGIQYSPGSQTYADGVDAQMGKWTDDLIQKQAAERRERTSAKEKAITNPETLEEFRQFIEHHGARGLSIKEKQEADALSRTEIGAFIRRRGESKLSPEQRAKYEEELTRAGRISETAAAERKNTVAQVEVPKDLNFTLSETKHTTKGHTLFVVQQSARVDRETFDQLSARAKKLGGSYSSYNKGGAIPGFQFKDKASAEQFMANEKIDGAARVELKADTKKSSAVTKLRDLAASARAKANDVLNADRQTNTARRVRMANSTEADARAEIRIADTMDNLAAAIESNDVEFIDRINNRAQVKTLDDSLRSAQNSRIQKDNNFRNSDEERAKPITNDDIAHAKFPTPYVPTSQLNDIIARGKNSDGLKKLAARVEKIAARDKEGVNISDPAEASDVFELATEVERRGYDAAKWVSIRFENTRRLQGLGINTDAELRTALREYLKFRAGSVKADPVKQLERELVGKPLEGFFPTPKPLIKEMLRRAEIEDGMSVLEPSAGKGDIIDGIKEKVPGANVHAIEREDVLRRIIEAKGHTVLPETNFLQHSGVKYDRIIMNPPFENGQDIEHVRHAFSLLKPGGKVVAIMSEGPFFRTDKKATAFRDWLEANGGYSEQNAAGSFSGSDAFRQTGTATRLVVLDAPADTGPLGSPEELPAKGTQADDGSYYRSLPISLNNAGIEVALETYNRLPNAEPTDIATKIIEASEASAYDAAMADRGELPAVVHNALAVQLLKKMQDQLSKAAPEQSDDLRRKIQALSSVASRRATEYGQAVQIYATLSPAEAATRSVVNGIEEEQDEATGGKGFLGRVAKILGEAGLKPEAVRPIIDKLTGAMPVTKSIWQKYREEAAKRVLALFDTSPKKPSPLLQAFTNRVTQELRAKLEAIAPQRAKEAQMTPAQIIGEALKNPEKYAEAWETARAELAKEHPDRIDEIDDLMADLGARPYSKKQLDRAIRDAHRQLKVKLSDLARQHFSKAKTSIDDLKKAIVAQTGVTEANAAVLAKDIVDQIGANRKAEQIKILEQMAKRHATAKKQRTTLHAIEKAVRLNNLGAFDEVSMRDFIAKELKLPNLTADHLKEISRLGDAVEMAPNAMQKHRAELDLAHYLRRVKGFSVTDIVTAMFFANMLSGPKTHIANAAGNAINGTLQLATVAITNPKQAGTAIGGYLSGFKNGWDNARSIISTGRGTAELDARSGEAGNVLESVNFKRDFPGLPKSAATVLQTVTTLKYVTRAMRAMDAIFFHPAKEAYTRVAVAKLMAGQYEGKELRDKVREVLQLAPDQYLAAKAKAEAEGWDGMDLALRTADILGGQRKEAIDKQVAAQNGDVLGNDNPNAAADRFALQTTYNNIPEGWAGILYKHLSGLTGDIPAAKVVLPFLRIPTNIFNSSLNFTPVGAIRAISGKTINGITSDGDTRTKSYHQYTADERNRMFVQATAGSLMIAGLVLMALKGDDEKEKWFDISAGGPMDFAKRAQLEATGWMPHAIKLGDRWFSYKDSGLLLPLSIAGNTVEQFKYHRSEPTSLKLTKAFGTAPAVIFDTSMLSGLGQFMGYVGGTYESKDGQKLGEFLAKVPVSVVMPNFLNQVDRAFDDDARQADNFGQKLRATIPFARRLNPTSTDVLGDNKEARPRFTNAEGNDPVREVLRDKGIFISTPQRDTKLRGVEMTPDQYREFVKLSGEGIMRRLKPAVAAIRLMPTQRKVVKDGIEEMKNPAEDYVSKIVAEERARAKLKMQMKR